MPVAQTTYTRLYCPHSSPITVLYISISISIYIYIYPIVTSYDGYADSVNDNGICRDLFVANVARILKSTPSKSYLHYLPNISSCRRGTQFTDLALYVVCWLWLNHQRNYNFSDYSAVNIADYATSEVVVDGCSTITLEIIWNTVFCIYYI